MDSGRVETIPSGTHLDTVRSLHQTVVSLRNALELSKNELQQLKEKYKKHSECINYEDLIEKLTLENHVLRRKIIDTGQFEPETQDINLQVTYTDAINNTINLSGDAVEIETVNTNLDSEILEQDSKTDSYNEDQVSSSESILDENLDINVENSQQEEIDCSSIVSSDDIQKQNSSLSCPSKESHNSIGGFKTKFELLSKFDVKIKVRTLKEGTVSSTTTSDSESTLDNSKKPNNVPKSKSPNSNIATHCFEQVIENTKEIKDLNTANITIKSVSEENITMAVPRDVDGRNKNDKLDVEVKISSEENLVIDESIDRNKRKETLHLDVDDLSYRSTSDGDNSVFLESASPAEPTGGRESVLEQRPAHTQNDQEIASDNDSEEVDDIELIFTTDDSKDVSNLQEGLVSIKETEFVTSPTSTTHSTPVLIKFHTLDSDFQPQDNHEANHKYQDNINLKEAKDTFIKQKRVSLPNDKEIRHVFSNVKSLDLPSRGILKSSDSKYDGLYKKSPNASTRRLDSVDSLTYDHRGLSFETKSSSYEISSSMDVLQRDESMDSFHSNCHMRHRFSVFAGADISKCGISEDDLVGNLNVRRNTCPNPFQYRGQTQLGPRLYVPRYNARGGRGKRESGAQTVLSALPKWSSDGHLAHNITCLGLPPPGPTIPRLPPPRRPSTTQKRQLLSDIDFTSMVPELSRSADPLCAMAAQNHGYNNVMGSRGFRSPCVSVDRTNDWTPQTLYAPQPHKYGGRMWRTSLPDVRHDDTDELLEETEAYLRRSIDNLKDRPVQSSTGLAGLSRPYIPAEPRHLRLGHLVKVITPQGRVAVGRVRYVGLAGGSTTDSAIMVGAIFPTAEHQYLPLNDGTYNSRRYFLAPPNQTALFVPFRKVLLAWAN